MRKGSVSIFSLLVMVLVASTLFVLLEATRCMEIQRLSKIQTQLAIESAFANYDSFLWEEYILLGCDVDKLESQVMQSANSKVGSSLHGLNLLKFGAKDSEVLGYTLITDGDGAVYEHAVASSMKETLVYGMAKELFNQYEVIKQLAKESSWSPMWLVNGLSQKLEGEDITAENPMQEAISMQNKGVLKLVIEDTEVVSNKCVNVNTLVSHRTLMKGKNAIVPENDWLDKVLLQQYVLQNLSNYCKQIPNRGMDYEVEYLIGGNKSDIENIQHVVNQLLILRQMTNFLYLISNPMKMNEAGAIALALAGISANPLAIETVKMGVIAAWAFGESVLDVRALLQGKKIPLLKSENLWTLEISEIGSVEKSYITAKECEDGLSYQEYLGILLLFLRDSELSMRAMDMQEITLCMKEGNVSFCMDEIMVRAKVGINYYVVPVFLTIYPFNNVFFDSYYIWKEQEYNYY